MRDILLSQGQLTILRLLAEGWRYMYDVHGPILFNKTESVKVGYRNLYFLLENGYLTERGGDYYISEEGRKVAAYNEKLRTNK